MSFGIPVRNGLSVGIGSTVSLTSGAGAGGRSRQNQPTLILDFVGPSVSGASLDMNFADTPAATYEVYAPDASQPQAGFINLQVWN
jgi:hypothetical protein